MNILFLTLSRIYDLTQAGIYTDLLRCFKRNGHAITVVTPIERRFKGKTRMYKSEGVDILQVKTLNIQKTNWIEKGCGTLLIEQQYTRAIKKYLSDITFDLILYTTPPITLVKPIQYIKKRDGASTYLMLKDIFPQNAVDLELFTKDSIFYNYFSSKEKALYCISDRIGCMSPANVEYMKKHNPEIEDKLEICPNAIDSVSGLMKVDKESIKNKYLIPTNATVFIYGGNLGKPQGIDFLLEVIESQKKNSKAFFLVIGSGTEYNRIADWFDANQPSNALLYKSLPVEEYEQLVQVADVGLIFLDARFTIPNYPSRLLGYLKYKKPIIAATDVNTDIGTIAVENNYGFSCVNGDLEAMSHFINQFVSNKDLIIEYGQNGYDFMMKHYTVENVYNQILNSKELNV